MCPTKSQIFKQTNKLKRSHEHSKIQTNKQTNREVINIQRYKHTNKQRSYKHSKLQTKKQRNERKRFRRWQGYSVADTVD